MELFNLDGHISDAGFAALLAGEADTLGSLELSEHLAFCDLCCEKYASLLSGDLLLTPPEPIAPGVMARLRRKARVILFNRYIKVGLAASLAMALWLAGTGSGVIPIETMSNAKTPVFSQPDTAQRLLERQQKEAAAMQASLDALATHEKESAAGETLNMKISSAVEALMQSIKNKGAN